MYALVRDVVLRLVKAPTRPPDPPAGSHGSVRAFRAHPRFLTYSLLSLFLGSVASYLIPAGLVVLGLVNREAPPYVMGMVLVPLFAIAQFLIYFVVRIDYDMRYYVVTDRSLRVREGALVVREKTITFANVQNIRVVQGPLLRIFGIRHLELDTAGGGRREEPGKHHLNRHRVTVAGIDNAHEIRDLILDHLRRLGRDAGLGDPDDLPGGGSAVLPPAADMVAALRELRAVSSALRTAAEGGGG